MLDKIKVWRPKQLAMYRSIRKIDNDAFVNDLNVQPWSVLVAFDNVDNIADTFTKLYIDIFNKHAPLKTKLTHKRHQPWISCDILGILRHLDKLYYNFRPKKTDATWIAYKVFRNNTLLLFALLNATSF